MADTKELLVKLVNKEKLDADTESELRQSLEDQISALVHYLNEYPLNRKEHIDERIDVWMPLIDLSEVIEKDHNPEKNRYHLYTDDSSIYNYFTRKGIKPALAFDLVGWVRLVYPNRRVISNKMLDEAYSRFDERDLILIHEIEYMKELDKAFDVYYRDVEKGRKEAGLNYLKWRLPQLLEKEIEADLMKSLYQQRYELIESDQDTAKIDKSIEQLKELYARLQRNAVRKNRRSR